MKTIAMIAALAAVTIATAAQASNAPTSHNAGGPLKHGKYCWVYTDGRGAGWWDLCDNTNTSVTPHGISQRGMTESAIMAVQSGAGDGGSAGGGSGGGGGR